MQISGVYCTTLQRKLKPSSRTVHSDGEKMGKLIVACLVVLALGVALRIHKSWRTICTLRQHADTSWRRLSKLLSDRHLVISHLVDAVESERGRGAETAALSTATARAESYLNSVTRDSSKMVNTNTVSEHQMTVTQTLQRILEVAESNPELGSQQSIAGCLAGIATVNDEIQLALAAYNDSAITYTTHVNTSSGAMIARITRCNATYRLVDWTTNASSTDHAMPTTV